MPEEVSVVQSSVNSERKKRYTAVDCGRPKDLIKTNLKHVINGTRVIVSGTCSTYPCTKDGWRCQQCISTLEEKYQCIILELQQEHKGADAEVFERRAQMVEMRKVIELANEQMPILQEKTQNALSHAAECEAERDKLKLQVLDLNQQLVLAGTETVQDRLRDTELQLAKAQEALTDTRHELSKSKAAGKEWQKQQRLAALDLDNYRRYIKTAREKEKHFKAEMAQANKRQVAVALELAKKDDSAIELKRRIDELSKVAEETFQQQQAMQHQNDGLLDVVQQLSHALEEAAKTEDEMRLVNAAMHRNEKDQTAEMAQLQGAVAIQRNATLSTKWMLSREKVRRREAEEHARRMNLLFPSAAAAAEDLPPPPPKVWQRDKDQQESLLASKMVETREEPVMVMNPPSGQMMKPPSFKAPSRELSEASRSLSLTAGARSSSLLLSRPHDTTTSPYQPPSPDFEQALHKHGSST